MWKSTVRENLGFIFAFVILILFRRRRQLVQSFQKLVNHGVKYINRLFYAPIYGSPATIPTNSRPYDSKYPNSVLYFRRRFFGTEYFVVESAYVANTLAEHADYFENSSFLNRIFRLCRRSTPVKGLEKVLRAHINAADSRNLRGEVGGSTTSSSAVDKAYQKFAMEMSAKGDEKVGHRLYQTLFEDGGKENRMELAFDAKNGEYQGSLMETIVPGLRVCIKELVVLLEAKANRRNEIDIRQYGYKHAVNVLGVAFFGQSIEELNSSGCAFYSRFDELYEMWLRSERGSLFPAWLKRFGKSTKSNEEVTQFFKKMVVECVNQNGNKCLLRSLAEKCGSMGESRDELIETLSEFAMAFSIYSVEVIAGAVSIILHELSKDADLQEKIRDKDKMKFSLEGLPDINAEFLSESLYVESLIKETFKTFPIDPLIQLSCKRVYRIPNTSFRINPKSVVLIPVNVLQTDNNLYPSMDSSDLSVNQEMEKEYAFITDSEMQSFFVFVNQFVDTCLKTTLPGIIQIYEFKADVKLNYEYGTSCRFSTLQSALPLRTSQVEKRGKIVIFEESLKAFHASKDVPFLSKIGL